MNCILKPYKLAWLEGNTLHSSMHDTLAEAQQQASIIAAPKIIMQLREDGQDGTYSWVMLGGPWAWMARNYILLATGIAVIILLLLYVTLKK